MLKLFRLFASLFILLFAASASAGRQPQEYNGEDGGYLVYSVGSIAFGMNYTFFYKYDDPNQANPRSQSRSQSNSLWNGHISPKTGGAIYLRIKNPDFEGRESGHVVARRLPPGNYSIESFYFGGGLPGVGYYDWSSAVPFKIEFTIEPGKATYIGSFMRAASLGTSLEPQLGAAGFFVIANRAERDLPIAPRKYPNLPEVLVKVTDVSQFGSAALRNSEP